jgi:hypothetical protein
MHVRLSACLCLPCRYACTQCLLRVYSYVCVIYCMRMDARVDMCVRVRINLSAQVCICAYANVCVPEYVCICVFVYVLYAYMCMCDTWFFLCVYIFCMSLHVRVPATCVLRMYVRVCAHVYLCVHAYV